MLDYTDDDKGLQGRWWARADQGMRSPRHQLVSIGPAVPASAAFLRERRAQRLYRRGLRLLVHATDDELEIERRHEGATPR
jgi:hypothetical protein